MINIALEEGVYFRSKEWCESHKDKLLTEHNQQAWMKKFFKAVSNLEELERKEKFGRK